MHLVGINHTEKEDYSYSQVDTHSSIPSKNKPLMDKLKQSQVLLS